MFILKVNIIVFDMDDTLYDEINYVKSAFLAVSKYFAANYNIKEVEFNKELLQNLKKNGRGQIFDDVLKSFKIYSKKNVKQSLKIYRMHKPNIQLRSDAQEILEYFKDLNTPIYLVTDGNKIVQRKKVDALDLEGFCKRIMITHNYGIKNSKPSTYCFEKIALFENEKFENIVYIGDNINKDFVNIKKLGFKTIRLKNGMFKDVKKSISFHADIDINSLLELKKLIKGV